jgi:hypothetical protein
VRAGISVIFVITQLVIDREVGLKRPDAASVVPWHPQHVDVDVVVFSCMHSDKTFKTSTDSL